MNSSTPLYNPYNIPQQPPPHSTFLSSSLQQQQQQQHTESISHPSHSYSPNNAQNVNINQPSSLTYLPIKKQQAFLQGILNLIRAIRNFDKWYQFYLDKSTPHGTARWTIFFGILILFIIRIVSYQGFYVVAYCLAIYLLNILILFLTPKFGPITKRGGSEEEESLGFGNDEILISEDWNPSLPSSSAALEGGEMSDNGNTVPSNASISFLPVGRDDEFRPFLRRLPEFRAWYSAIRATLFALIATLIPLLDIPVFWPILVLYWVTLTVITMRRQIRHMIKYHYVPFDLGKKNYGRVGNGESIWSNIMNWINNKIILK